MSSSDSFPLPGRPRPVSSAAPSSTTPAQNTAPQNTAPQGGERRLAIGKLVRNAAPSDDVVARILEQRNAKKADPPRDDAGENASPQLDQIAEGIGQLFDFMAAVHEQETAQAKAFDALYGELSDYKNDFFAERLKPLAKSLLFLLDSIREYDAELEAMAKAQQPLDHNAVRSHVAHFADQLDDALRMADLEPVELEGERFDPKTQRAVEVVTVEKARDGHVVRVVRPGWTLGGKPLRPADVVVGKS